MDISSAGVCCHCKNPFVKQDRGYSRRSCNLLFPGQSGFYCNPCFYLLKRQSNPSAAVKRTRVICSPRPAIFSPGKSPAHKKRYTLTATSSLEKTAHHLKVLTPTKDSTSVTKNVARSRFKPLLRTLLQRKGFCLTLEKHICATIQKELGAFCRQKEIQFRQPLSLQVLSQFNWEKCLDELQKLAPTAMMILRALLCKQGQLQQAGKGAVPVSTLGLVCGIVLNSRESLKCRLIQNMISLQMYRYGCPQKLFTTLNRLHLCSGFKASMLRVDTLIEEYKCRFLDEKKAMEEFLAQLHKGSKKAAARRLIFTEETVEKTSASAEITVPSVSYTFCWDNTQISVEARHQEKDKNVWMRLWALCYAATNRVRTEFLPDEEPRKKAVDIPISTFLPSPEYAEELQHWMEIHVKETLSEHLLAFQSLRSVQKTITHNHWDEMKKKSEVINLGVLEENPSTTDGVITIMEHLSDLVPRYPDGKPFTIITHCDGGAFERMVSARKVRAADHGPMRQLLGVEPSAQEFHKRGIMLQIIMDRFFHGSSQGDRGTLSNIKAVMGHHSVKGKVMDCFNHVESMFDVTCDGLICLLAMQCLGITEQNEEPPVLKFCDSEEEREQILEETAFTIVKSIWQHPTTEAIAQVANAPVLPEIVSDDICCGLEIPGKLIVCSNGNCGGIFHIQCVEAINGEVPSLEDDWWCSEECEEWSKFCTCKRFIDGADMVECGKRKSCSNGQWFHLQCVGLDHLPGKDETWLCQACQPISKEADCLHNYTVSLLWMLLSDRLRRTAIRNGDGPMLLKFWKEDGIHFWNENHNKYLILMHRMTAGVNGWLSERQAADITWNRTVNIHGGGGRNVAMDKVNEFLNNDFKENLKHSHGKYTEQVTQRSSYIAGGVTRDLDAAFRKNVAPTTSTKSKKRASTAEKKRVSTFLSEYQEDRLFEHVPGRHHKHFPEFDMKLGTIKKPSKYKSRLLKYSVKLDRGRYACRRDCD